MSQQRFLQGCQQLGLTLTPTQIERFDAYVAALTQWNATFNLVAPSTLQDMYTRHLLDCAQLATLIPGGPVLDMGAGAGLPAVPLAILLDMEIEACERVGKKVQFMRHVSREMGLTNLTVHQKDVRELDGPYTTITARALASLDELISFAYPLSNSASTFVFPKGEKVQEEFLHANKKWVMTSKMEQSITLDVSKICVLTDVRPKS